MAALTGYIFKAIIKKPTLLKPLVMKIVSRDEDALFYISETSLSF